MVRRVGPVQANVHARSRCTRLLNLTRQYLSELREGHVLRDQTPTATGEAFGRVVGNDAAAPGYRLDVAATAALLARHLDANR
jgi:hypothetical protein